MIKKFDKTKTIEEGYRPIYTCNVFTMVNLESTIMSMKALHGFCVCNCLPSGRIAKLQGGYYVLTDDLKWELIAGSLSSLDFGTLYNKLKKLKNDT